MSEELKNLRAKIAALKAAPIFQKAAIAEQAMDAALVVIERLDAQNKALVAYVERLGFQLNRVQFQELSSIKEAIKNGKR